MGLLPLAAPLVAVVYAGWQTFNYFYWQRARVSPPPTGELPSVAVIVPFRNEAEQLPHLVGDLLDQDYPPERYTLVLVDDHSEDGRGAAGARLRGGDSLLRLADEPRFARTRAHKKAALTLGIEHTDADLIVTTDADCRWPKTGLRELAGQFAPETDMVLGSVWIDRAEDACSALQGLDLAGYQLFTAASVAAGAPALANGACLAFRRNIFLEVGGYRGVDHLPSGDDVLLLHKFAAAGFRNIRYLSRPTAAVTTRAVGGWAAFWRQRLRWAGKAGAYVNPLLQLAQALAFGTSAAILLSLILGMYDPDYLWAGLLAWATKAIVDGVLLHSVCRHFGRGRWMRWYPVAQLIYPFYLVGVGTAALLGVKTEWKGRPA